MQAVSTVPPGRADAFPSLITILVFLSIAPLCGEERAHVEGRDALCPLATKDSWSPRRTRTGGG